MEFWAETWAGDLNKCSNHMGDDVRTGIPKRHPSMRLGQRGMPRHAAMPLPAPRPRRRSRPRTADAAAHHAAAAPRLRRLHGARSRPPSAASLARR
jgi:hypothetical protein